VLARRLFDDDSLRPLGGVIVSAAEYKRNCAFVQALTNDIGIAITKFDVEHGKITILGDGKLVTRVARHHYLRSKRGGDSH